MSGVSLDIWCVIASYCDTKDILSIFQLNKAINRLSTYRPLYQMICNRHNIEIRPSEQLSEIKCKLLENKYKLNVNLMSAYHILFHNCNFADFAKCAFRCDYAYIKTRGSTCTYYITLYAKKFRVRCIFEKVYGQEWVSVHIYHYLQTNHKTIYLCSFDWGKRNKDGYCSQLEFINIMNNGLNIVNADTMNEVLFLANYLSNKEKLAKAYVERSMINYYKYEKLLPLR